MILGYPLEVLRLRVSSDYALKLCASSLVLHALCDCLHKLKNCCIKSTEAMRHLQCCALLSSYIGKCPEL